MRCIPAIDRLMAMVSPEPNTGCWLWTGHTNDKGYGMMGRGGAAGGMATSHRISFEVHRGPIPKGMAVLHRCDVRSCVNPDHLFLGTQLENVADRQAKGRQARGSAVGGSRLNESAVREIRAQHIPGTTSYLALAKRFGVAPRTVLAVAARETWRHVQ